jgi:hypothetical protein
MHLQVRLRGFPGVDGMLVTRRRIEFLCGQTILPSRCCHVPAMLIFVFLSAGKQPQSAGGADRGRLYLQVLSLGGQWERTGRHIEQLPCRIVPE